MDNVSKYVWLKQKIRYFLLKTNESLPKCPSNGEIIKRLIYQFKGFIPCI